jgi:hypothetical protein
MKAIDLWCRRARCISLRNACASALRFGRFVSVADGHCGLRRDSVEQVGLVFAELTPRIQVQLHRAHQLTRALHWDDQHVHRVAATLDPWGRAFVELDHQRPHGGDCGVNRLLV